MSLTIIYYNIINSRDLVYNAVVIFLYVMSDVLYRAIYTNSYTNRVLFFSYLTQNLGFYINLTNFYL